MAYKLSCSERVQDVAVHTQVNQVGDHVAPTEAPKYFKDIGI